MHSCSHHAWVSFEANAEIYNEANRETNNINSANLTAFVQDRQGIVIQL